MKSYVDIKTLYSSQDERTINNLKTLYDHIDLLCESIRSVMISHITSDDIRCKRVLLKPNFVREIKNKGEEICLTTHTNFIIAALKFILECKPQSVIIGDAPIQNCRWDLLLSQELQDSVGKLSKDYNIPVKIVDFRKVIYYPQSNKFDKSSRTDDDYLIFDVGERSLLEPVTDKDNKFRITNYNPDRMAMAHSKGKHQYCIAKEIFESDIVISIPKPKTHRMACLTNSLKVLVGINGDKDYLPHHRIGSEIQGGDCYKDFNVFRTWGEKLLDSANRRRGSVMYKPLYYTSRLIWRMGCPNNEVTANAGWYGNDTVWRMVMDINTIAQYGKIDGTLAEKPQRVIYTLCDGIIGGQGNGPLNPAPLALGLIAFSNDSYLMDEVMGYIFGLNLQKVPLLRQATVLNGKKDKMLLLNGISVDLDEIKLLKTDVKLAPGWVNYDK